MWDDELDENQMVELAEAYIRRKVWETDLLAARVAGLMLGGMMGGGEVQRVTAGQLMAYGGVTV